MSREKSITLAKGFQLKGGVDSSLGLVIQYLQQIPENRIEVGKQTLTTRFLPFVLDKNDPNYLSIALTCATACESWAKAIREYSGLPPGSIYSEVSGVQSYPLVSPLKEASSLETNELSEIEPEENELDKFKQKLQEIVDNASNVNEARKKLVQIQPEEEEDWTEEQWDLWDEYCNKQEDIIHQQLYGELSEQLRGGIHE